MRHLEEQEPFGSASMMETATSLEAPRFKSPIKPLQKRKGGKQWKNTLEKPVHIAKQK